MSITPADDVNKQRARELSSYRMWIRCKITTSHRGFEQVLDKSWWCHHAM